MDGGEGKSFFSANFQLFVLLVGAALPPKDDDKPGVFLWFCFPVYLLLKRKCQFSVLKDFCSSL